MKVLHISDLHLGKRLYEYDLYEDQAYMLRQVIDVVKERAVDVLLIAGDIFDRSIPAVRAVTLLDEFLTELSGMGISVFMISGNHDSPERLGFLKEFLKESGIYLVTEYDGELTPVILQDVKDTDTLYVLMPMRV